MANQKELLESVKRRSTAAVDLSHEAAEKRQRKVIWVMVVIIVLLAAVATKVLSSDARGGRGAGVAIQAHLDNSHMVSR